MNILKSLRFYSSKVAPEVNLNFQNEWNKAKPFKSIPSLSKLEAFRRFLPGGKFYNLKIIEMQKSIVAEFGHITRFPAILNRPETVMVFNADDVKKVFQSEGSFPIRNGLETLQYYRKTIRPDIYNEFGSLLTEQKEDWYKMRTLVNPVMMKPTTVKLYIPQVDSISKSFIEMILNKRDTNSEVPPNFSDFLNLWSLESIARISLDVHLGIVGTKHREENAEKLIKLIRKLVTITHEFEMKPSIWRIYQTKDFKELLSVYEEITNIIMMYVEKSLEDLKLKKRAEDREESILEKLVKINKKVAVVMCADAMMAGVDTTSSAAIGIIYCLAKNQDKQEKLRKELRQILKNKHDELTPEKMQNMPYLRAVIKEGIRIYPPAIGTIRKTSKDLVLSGYQVPKGSEVALNMLMIQKDEKYFPEPEKFIPERWLKTNTEPPCSRAKSSHPFAYLPWGFGPRMCIGRRFAELEIEILLIRLIRDCKVEWNYPDMKIKSLLVNIPDGDLKFKITEL